GGWWWSGLAKSRARDEALEGCLGACSGARIVQQTVCAVERERGAVELERELLRIEIGAQIAFPHGALGGACDAVEPGALPRDEVIAQISGLVVELDRGAEQRAPAGERIARGPGQPVLEQGLQAGEAARFAQRGHDDGAAELERGLLEDGFLPRFLGAEVGEKAALREARAGRAPADRQAGDCFDARDRAGGARAGGPRRCAFAAGLG